MSTDQASSLQGDFALPGPAKIGMFRSGSLGWLARHEFRLALRAWLRPGKVGRAILSTIGLLIVLHVFAFGLSLLVPAKQVLARAQTQPVLMIVLDFGALSILAMMITQAMEAVTRAFYVRGDLELILSSPMSARRVFAVRMVAITATTMSLVGFLLLPFVNLLAIVNDWRWLSIYGVLLALAALAQAIALLITMGLFLLIGPKRTRLIAQIFAAVIGAATVIGTQVPMILRSGTLSRLEFLNDAKFIAGLPDQSSWIWVPARAAHGDFVALAIFLILAISLLAITVTLVSNAFAGLVIATAGVAEVKRHEQRRSRFSSRLTAGMVLRRKELRLILRDPWLVSQSLMQILYLFPPALLLWRNFSVAAGQLTVLVPVLVMASGQLAGGLAWLAISAEDAPDLIATAPLAPNQALRAKVEAILLAIAAVFGPFMIWIGIVSPLVGLIGTAFAFLAAASTTFVQYLFRTGASRSQFRLRQRSSRAATLAETFCSIAWAAASGLMAVGNPAVMIPMLLAIIILLLCTWLVRPPDR